MAQKRRGTCHIAKITEDGILCKILSYLNLRDVARTSVLSSRWRHIWEYAPNLNFDSENVLGIPDFLVDGQDQVRNMERFVSFLDEFMKHHRGNGVEKFMINFPFNKKHAHHLNKWVNFGVLSGAKDFRLILKCNLFLDEPYDFPCKLFACGRGSSIKQLYLGSIALKLPANFDGFASLKAIDLEDVVMNEGDIQNLMRCCPALESMHIRECQDLVNLNISHPSNLKFLKVSCCSFLKRIELSGENLTSFEYTGEDGIIFLFKNTPRLTSVSFYFENYSNSIHYVLSRLADDLPQIESLSLHTREKFEVSDLPVNSKKFTHLKHLVISVSESEADHLLWLATLLNAAPFVEKLQLFLCSSQTEDAKEREILKPSNCPHEHLKTVLISGFTWIVSHVEIATYLLDNAPRLELLAINGGEESAMWIMNEEFYARHAVLGKDS